MKKSIVALGIVLTLSGCAAAADETLAAEPAALVEISPATEETAQPVEAAATAEPAQTATLSRHPNRHRPHARADSRAYGSPRRRTRKPRWRK